MPFDALPGPDGEPLGATRTVTWQASVPLALWLTRRASATDPSGAPAVFVVGAGDPAAGGWDGLAPLPFDGLELGERAYAEGRARRAGTAEVPQAPAASLLHVFGHGRYDAARPRPAGVIVAPEAEDGVWFASDFEDASPLPSVVLISACGSGRARPRRGDDGRGTLHTAAFRGGAVAVLSPTLDLELFAAADLSRELHGALARGETIASALREARRSARPGAHGVPWIHSYLVHAWGAGGHAPFADGRAERSATDRTAVLLAGAGAALAVGLAIAFRLRPGRAAAVTPP